jgi:hypothetical protein
MNIEHLLKITDTLLSSEEQTCRFKPDDESPFPLDALPRVLKDAATEVAWAYQAPIDLVAPQTLSVMSACLGKGINLQTNHPDPTFGHIFMFLGTRPGICKTTVLKWLSKPMKEYQKKVRLDYKNEVRVQLIDEFEERSKKPVPKDWQPSQKDINEAVGKTEPTLIAEHYSQEGLATTLSYNDEYLALMSTDVSGVIDGLRGAKSGGHNQGEILLKGYAGESYDCNNKVAMDEHLEEIRLTINWLGTTDTLKTFVTDPQIKGRGLLSRFLFAEIDKPIPPAQVDQRKVATGVSEKWHDLLIDMLSKYWRSKSVDTVKMSTEAIQSIVDFRNEYVNAQDELFGLSSLPERWAENALRIALVLHLCKYRNRPADHELDESTMADAIRIMWWFIGREMACIDAVKGYDPVINDKKVKALNALTKHGPCTMRDLYKKAGLKKQDTGMVMQWARDGELVKWNASKGNRASPTFALVGDDRIPKGAELITN